jgi:hypothetical protein
VGGQVAFAKISEKALSGDIRSVNFLLTPENGCYYVLDVARDRPEFPDLVLSVGCSASRVLPRLIADKRSVTLKLRSPIAATL